MSAANQSSPLEKLDRVISAILNWSCGICLAALLFLVGAGVFVRFVPISSMAWADEIVEFGFAWMVFFGAALLWRNGTHFRVDLLPHLLAGTKAAPWLEVVVNFISLLFFLILAWQGTALSIEAVDTSPILELQKSIWYAVIPAAAFIMIGYTVRDIVRLTRRARGQEAVLPVHPVACSPEPEILRK